MSEEVAAETTEISANSPEQQEVPAEAKSEEPQEKIETETKPENTEESNEKNENTEKEASPEKAEEEKPAETENVDNQPKSEEPEKSEEKAEQAPADEPVNAGEAANEEKPAEDSTKENESEKNEDKNQENAPEEQANEEKAEEDEKKDEPPSESQKEEAPSESQKEEEKKEEVAKLPDEPATTEKGIPVNERCMWIPEAMETNDEAVEMRERTRNWFGSYSYGRLKRVNFTTCSNQLDRFRVLQLIYQYLHSIGLHHVADSLCAESKLEYQRKDQNMERTDLRLIISMSLGPRDYLWDDTGLENINMMSEMYDDDNNSVRFEEKLGTGCEPADYESEMKFVEGAEKHTFAAIESTTIHALVCALIINNPDFIDKKGRNTVFATLSSICHATHFFAHIQSIYATHENLQNNVMELIDDWISFSGLFIGKKTLGAIAYFLGMAENEKAKDIIAKIGQLDYGHPLKFTEHKPAPIMTYEKYEGELTKEQLSKESEAAAKLLNPNLTIADPVPEETARQITLITQRLFSRINPYEFYNAISSREYGALTQGLIELHEFGYKLKKLVIGTIVNEGNKEKAARNMGIVIQIAEKLLELNNFESVSWIVDAFQSKAIANLSGIYASLGAEKCSIMNNLIEKFNSSNKSQEYESKILECISNKLPAVPNVRYELEIISAYAYGGEDFPDMKINMQKRCRIGNVACRFIDLQNVHYNFADISQIQDVMSRGCSVSKENINKYSIMIESTIKGTDEEAKEPAPAAAPAAAAPSPEKKDEPAPEPAPEEAKKEVEAPAEEKKEEEPVVSETAAPIE